MEIQTILYLFLGVFGLFIAADLVFRWLNLRPEYFRKLIHAATAVMIAAAAQYTSRETIIWAVGFCLVLLAISKYTNFLPGVHKVERTTHGEFYFPVAAAASACWFLPQDLLAFQFGILVMGLSDAAAEIIGKLYGRHPLKLVKSKTWEGSAAFFVTTLVIFWFLVYPDSALTWMEGLILSAGLTVVEAALIFGLDNLLLPIVASLALRWML